MSSRRDTPRFKEEREDIGRHFLEAEEEWQEQRRKDKRGCLKWFFVILILLLIALFFYVVFIKPLEWLEEDMYSILLSYLSGISLSAMLLLAL